jgi:hypothetical protein
MRKAFEWSKTDVVDLSKLGAIFVAIGAVYGLLKEGNPVIGALAGAILFVFMMGIGALAHWLSVRFEKPW